MADMDTKVCSRCKRELDVDKFYKDSRSNSGFKWQCKDCTRENYKNIRAQLNYDIPQKKACTKCKRELASDNFYKNKNEKYGLGSHCKDCHKHYHNKIKEQLIYEIPCKQICRRCKLDLPAANFYKDRTIKSGLQKVCKECEKTYREQNRLKVTETRRLYHIKNKERLCLKAKEHYQANKEHHRQVSRKWEKDNPDKFKEYRRQFEKIISERLTDTYIKKLITSKQKILKCEDIPQTLIDLKRVQVQITRKLREIKKCDQPR